MENMEKKKGVPPFLTDNRHKKFVKITVKDNGTGIPPENIQKIFNPFFTTKKDGNGLGLSIVYMIIKNHKGHISLDSSPGKGTCLTIYLPAAENSM